MKLTQEQKRIKIAEACNIFDLYPLRYATRKGKLLPEGDQGVRPMYCEHSKGGWQEWTDVPNYFNDLNAMYKAFKRLFRKWEVSQVDDEYLVRIRLEPENKDIVYSGLELLPVMGEVLGMALNLWKDGE